MHHSTKLLKALFMFLIIPAAFGSYYDTLPEGVRTFGFGYVHSGSINSSYGTDRDQFDYLIRQDLNAAAVSGAHPALKSYFDELKRIDPSAYDSFSFGEYEGSGEAEVNVKGLGFGYGISKKLTVFGIVPIYSAEVKMNVNRTAGNNYQHVQSLLSQQGNSSDTAYLMSQITGIFPDANPELLQSIIVNNFGYQPVGNWSASGLGDIELGAMYRLTEETDYGIAIAGGIILPTGRVDNPDILQDTGFGDGQTDLYAEIGGGISFFKGKLDIDSSVRYAYQLSSTKTLRVPEDEVFRLSPNKGEFTEKLGNRIEYMAKSTWHWNDWISSYGLYNYTYIGSAEYDSEFTEANRILAINSDSETQLLGAGVTLSTTTLFKKGILAVPASVDLVAKKMVAGRNTPKYSRYEIQFKIFF
ncbi:MAG: hypothetical protein KC493_12070 [Bacteriovoracaceae bacterium]|nr:hypothetical protein [Bacteriovoracaceae bacterium]